MVNAEIRAVFEDGYVARPIPMEFFLWCLGLTVDYSSVKADQKRRDICAKISQKVDTAKLSLMVLRRRH